MTELPIVGTKLLNVTNGMTAEVVGVTSTEVVVLWDRNTPQGAQYVPHHTFLSSTWECVVATWVPALLMFDLL